MATQILGDILNESINQCLWLIDPFCLKNQTCPVKKSHHFSNILAFTYYLLFLKWFGINIKLTIHSMRNQSWLDAGKSEAWSCILTNNHDKNIIHHYSAGDRKFIIILYGDLHIKSWLYCQSYFLYPLIVDHIYYTIVSMWFLVFIFWHCWIARLYQPSSLHSRWL